MPKEHLFTNGMGKEPPDGAPAKGATAGAA